MIYRSNSVAAVRQEQIAVQVDNLQRWIRDVRSRMSRHAASAKRGRAVTAQLESGIV
jgi:hypothetical protein